MQSTGVPETDHAQKLNCPSIVLFVLLGILTGVEKPRQQNVFLGREDRQKARELKHKADLFIAIS